MKTKKLRYYLVPATLLALCGSVASLGMIYYAMISRAENWEIATGFALGAMTMLIVSYATYCLTCYALDVFLGPVYHWLANRLFP